MKIGKIAALLIAGALSLASCSKQSTQVASPFLNQHVGQLCTVQFRRDALGAGASLPISPTTSGINGASVAQYGKLVAVERDGIVLLDESRGAQTFWIPYHAILLVEFLGVH